MARQRISLETKPHVIELDGLPDRPGEVLELLFKPEVYGDEFLDAYGELQDQLNDAGLTSERDLEGGGIDKDKVRKGNDAVREFLAGFMLPNSAELFATLRLPDWVLTRMTQTLVELYSNRPTGSSNGSRSASSKGGPRSTGNSRSKAKTRAAGR